MRLEGSRALELQGLDMGRGCSRGRSEARVECRLGGSLGLAGQDWGERLSRPRGRRTRARRQPGPRGAGGGRGLYPGRWGAAGPG